ncbi:MAG TPA: MerR family transcriptional regulator [Vicinamibacterales bacterium]|nr:MerR family transcriptional regulator [Vicinamibacterales bacterium]
MARRADLRASTIRFYEEKGLLPPAIRRGGRRVYGESILKRLMVIEVAKSAGFELDEIAVLLNSLNPEKPAPAWRKAAQHKQADLAAQMKTLTRMHEILEGLKGCECVTLDECAAGLIDAIRREPLDTPVSARDVQRVSRRRFARAAAR